MPITDEQAATIKKQILTQVNNFPEEQRNQAVEQIELMTNDELEAFLIQNNMIRRGENLSKSGLEGGNSASGEQQCVFCSIIEGKIPSYKIDENKKVVAILEINPISKGHALIIPREHVKSQEKIPAQAFAFAKKIANKIKSKLKPKPREITISSWSMFGHSIINVIPVYKDENLLSPRTKADEAELNKLMATLAPKKIQTVKKPRTKKIDLRDSKEIIRLPRRIP